MNLLQIPLNTSYIALYLIIIVDAMRLSSILQNIVHLPAGADREFFRLILDSRKAQSGDVFIALKGTQVDGRQFIKDALASGVAAVLVEAAVDGVEYQSDIPVIAIPALRSRLGEVAATFYGNPAGHVKMFGITGTNGKTSCTHFLAQMLQSFHIPCGVMGTLGNGILGSLGEPGLTTPDPITLHAMLKEFVNQGAKATVMEVSSHSIDQERINGIDFETGIFTNLTQDHLDYHGNMAAYAAVKQRFFTEYSLRHAIINVDDAYGADWVNTMRHPSVFAYGLQRRILSETIPYTYAENITLSLTGIRAHVVSPWGSGELMLPLVGEFNLSNILAVLITLCLQEIPFNDVLRALSKIKPVPGRMQLLGGHGKPLVVVDYSHTPDSLKKALQALKLHAKGRLICVFGCGGNRDAAKRPLMAQIAEELADKVVVTSDNPRHEDPNEIAQQIVKGLRRPDRADVILERSKAIEKSIQCAAENDCILIAGKGAEQYQQIGDVKYPFDDISHANKILNEAINEQHGES